MIFDPIQSLFYPIQDFWHGRFLTEDFWPDLGIFGPIHGFFCSDSRFLTQFKIFDPIQGFWPESGSFLVRFKVYIGLFYRFIGRKKIIFQKKIPKLEFINKISENLHRHRVVTSNEPAHELRLFVLKWSFYVVRALQIWR